MQLEIYRVVSGIFMLVSAAGLCLLYEIWRALKKKPPLDYIEIGKFLLAALMVGFGYYLLLRGLF